MKKNKKPQTNTEAEAQKVIGAVYPGFQEPLRIAHEWVRRGGEWVNAAILVLEYLRKEHRHVLKIGAELMLAYLESGHRDRAQQELAALEKSFPADKDEETLCRFGRLHREIGDDLVKADKPTNEQFRQAGREYDTAWRYYNRAFAIRSGHYPGINRASLYLLRAWAARSAEIQKALVVQSRDAADKLLKRRDQWPHEGPEDAIWHSASAAEAKLLLAKWQESLADYREALAHKLTTGFHRESIGKEVRRLQRPLNAVGKLSKKTAAELMKLFPAPAVQRADPERPTFNRGNGT